MRKYIGITIGPVFDTIMDASSPAAMWFGSFMFSDITRRLCEAITKAYEDVEIYSPYYAEETKISEDGVGKFHDRILFSVDDGNEDVGTKLDQIIDGVKGSTADYFTNLPDYDKEKTERFLKRYLQIHYIIGSENKNQNQNIILDLSDKLSALELIKTFPENNSDNPITRLMLGEESGKNELIKKSCLYKQIKDKSQLEEAGAIRTIGQIAKGQTGSERKLYKYFAVVNADGDRMGQALQALGNNKLNEFSQCLFRYASNASNQIKEFGGMTIYAGGDDLLFLAPVIEKNGKSIFSLCDEIQKQFRKEMEKSCNPVPTLSFGIGIAYYKYPLYEAMELSRQMLQESKSDAGKKNATTVQLQKHSGQSLKLKLSNEKLETMETFLGFDANPGNEPTAEILHSMIYSIEEFRPLYELMLKETMDKNQKLEHFQELWGHLFDNSDQDKYRQYINKIVAFFYEELVHTDAPLIEGYNENRAQILSMLLRLKKFFAEKGDEIE